MNSASGIILANQKGGVGKTTSSINLAYALSSKGEGRVLLVDVDPQASATQLLLSPEQQNVALKDRKNLTSILDKEIGFLEGIVSSESSGLPFDFIPATLRLADIDGRRITAGEFLLSDIINKKTGAYDWLVFDPPPNLGLLTSMALTASDYVVVPVRTEPTDLKSLDTIDETIRVVQARLNTHLRFVGYLPTQMDKRKNVDNAIFAEIQARPGQDTSIEPVPSSAIYGKATRGGAIAAMLYPNDPVVRPYYSLAEKLLAARRVGG